MKIITKLSIMASLGLLLIIALSACKGSKDAPKVVSSNEITISVGGVEPDWTSIVIVEDDVDEEIIIDESMIDTSNVNQDVIGVYKAIYTITDSDGNKTIFELTVNVVDKTNPLVELRGESFFYLTVGEDFIDPGVIIYDNYDTDLTYDVEGTVDSNTIGEYFLNYTVTDSSGNTSIKLTRLVVVENHKQMVSNKDDVYFSLDDFEITYEDLYNEMIDPSGLFLLLDYVDNLILSDYIDEISNEELLDEYNRLAYNTTDIDEINKLSLKEFNDGITLFQNTLLELGYSLTDGEDRDRYLALNIAKRKAFKDQFMNDELDDDFYPNSSTLEQYYNNTVKGDVCALELRFNSETEASNVFNHFNIVMDYNEGFGLYFGEEAIENVDKFSSVNTSQLGREETFATFLKIYNYLNPSSLDIPEDISEEALCINYPESVNYVYSDIIDEFSDNQIYLSYINYIFEDLNVLYDNFTYKPETFHQNEMFVFKISESEVKDFDDLSTIELDDLELEYFSKELLIDESVVNYFMYFLRSQHEFNIVEQLLGVLYQTQSSLEMDSYKDPNLMATLGELEITVDMFFDYAQSRLGTKYTVYLTAVNNLINNGIYEDLYGDNFDVLSNESEEIIELRAKLYQIKDYFELERYASDGFSSFEYSWSEFMFLFLNASSEHEAIMNLIIFQTLNDPYTMSDFDFELVSDYIQEQYDDFFDLNVEHLLLYIDFDNDFIPDNYTDYLDGLEGIEKDEFETMIDDFNTLVRDKYESGLSFEDIVKEYNDELLNDESNEWAIFRLHGFRLLREDLTANGQSLNLYNTVDYDYSFREALKRIYNDYSSLPVIEDSYLDPNYTNTEFGMHIILASQGNNFEKPSAYFDQSTSETVYSEGSNNLLDLPSQEQLTLYKTIVMSQQNNTETDKTLPDSVFDAIEYYYSSVFMNPSYSSSFLIEASEDIINKDALFTMNNEDYLERVMLLYESLLKAFENQDY